jgi:YfiR/HmsC-like
MRRPQLMITVLICLSLASPADTHAMDPVDSSEYLIKAGFVYNFAKLTEWPAGSFAQPDSPIVIGILGTDPFGATIDHVVDNKQINGRGVVVKRLKWGDRLKERQYRLWLNDLLQCNILFVSSSEVSHLDELISIVQGIPILTVGDTPGFAMRGGVINLILDDNKVRFEVNVEAARRANLNISSRLLALAKIVPQDGKKTE